MTAYDQLTHDEKMLLNAELQNAGKNVTVAYVLWFFLGTVGGHNFYLGKTLHGLIQMALTVFGWLTLFILIGFGFLFIVGVWLIADLFTIHKSIEQDKTDLREQKAQSVINQRPQND